MTRCATWLACLMLGIVGPAWAAPAPRIVSLNLCTDQLALALAEREQIAGLSFLSADPNLSFEAEKAKGHRLVKPAAETLWHLKPDLVVTLAGTQTATVALLRRLGMRVREFSLPRRLEEIPAYLRAAGEAFGAPERAEALIAQLQRQLDDAASGAAARRRPLMAVIEANHLAAGAETVMDELIRLAGGANLPAALKRSGYATLSLEELAFYRPELLFYQTYDARSLSQGETYLFHRVLARYHASGRAVELPSSLTSCPDHSVGAAALALAKGIDRALGVRSFAAQ